ncbi:SCO family protein [Thiosocius teredinicola]|uniref:SCO family protein n=1 Tax=Thiosocius teredinicola TaxID=1973002 RepID=UPI0013DE12E6
MKNNVKQILLIAVLAAVSIGIGLWAGMQGKPAKQETTGYPDLGGDFTLTSDKGPVSLHDFKGKIVPIYFGFTHCPDVCITSLSGIAAGLKQLTDEQRAQVQPLFITIDPERDDAARVGEYARYFDPSFIGLTGTLEEITQVAQKHFVIFEKVKLDDSEMGYTMDHSSIVYVVGKNGIIRELVHHSEDPEEIAGALRDAVAE